MCFELPWRSPHPKNIMASSLKPQALHNTRRWTADDFVGLPVRTVREDSRLHPGWAPKEVGSLAALTASEQNAAW